MRHPQEGYFPQLRCNTRKSSAKRYRRSKLLKSTYMGTICVNKYFVKLQIVVDAIKATGGELNAEITKGIYAMGARQSTYHDAAYLDERKKERESNEMNK